MQKRVVASILHGAYGDAYEQAICLKHYALTHPEISLRLFTATNTRYEAFGALDLSFAVSYEMWQTIPDYTDIDEFLQFQILDVELRHDVIEHLPPRCKQLMDMTQNRLPWQYLRECRLIPVPEDYSLDLSERGKHLYTRILEEHKLSESLWNKPTVSFLWRYRGETRGEAISNFGQASQQELVAKYSSLFKGSLQEIDCHLLVFGMKVAINDSNRERLDNKYPAFGLNLPPERVTYFQGLSWPVELEIASRADVCCGNPSGFTEALWLKRGARTVLMDAPYHYLAKIVFRRMPLFRLNRPIRLLASFVSRGQDEYHKQILSGL